MKNEILSEKEIQEENKILEEKLIQREAELSIISSVSEAISKRYDTNTIIRIIGDKVKEIFNSEVTEILLLDGKTNTINVPYSYYRGYQTVESFHLGDGLTSKVIKSRIPLLLLSFEDQLKNGAILDEGVGDADKTETYLGVPILFNEEILGVVSIQSYEKNAYDEAKVRLLSILATNMGVALENSRLFEETNLLLNETKQRNAELGVINSVQEGLVKELDINGIYELVGEKIRKIFNAQVVDIVTYDKTDNTVQDCYSYEKGDRTLVGKRPLVGFRKHVVETAEPLVINTDSKSESEKYGNPVVIGVLSKSILFVPIMTSGEVTSIISLQNLDIENAFSDSDVRLLTTLANSMSVALKNAQLFDETTLLLNETKQRNAELGVINSVQEGLVKEFDINGIYELVGEKIREIFNAQVVDIVTYDKADNSIQDCYAYEKGDRTLIGRRPLVGFRKHVVETAKPLVINHDTKSESEKYGNPVVIGELSKSIVLVPMITGNEVTSIISLQNLDIENAFSDSDIRLLTTLANSMSVALENARLFDETNRLLKETEQRKAELTVINSVQEGLVKQVDLQAVYDLVGEKINEIFDTQVVAIASFDLDNKKEIFNYVIEKGERYFPKSREYDKVREHLIDTKELILINENFIEAAKKYGMKVVSGTEMPKSLLFVPLSVGDKVNGYISLQNIDRENAFSASDVRLLTTLSNSMSVALENARLFDETNKLLDETKQQAIELKIINSVGEGLAKQLDFQSIIDLVGDKIREVFDAEIVSISTYDKETVQIHHRYAVELDERFTFDKPQAIDPDRKEIIDTKQPLIFNSAQEAIDHSGETVVAGEMPESFMGVPIFRGDEVTGVITVQDLHKQNLYGKKDVRLMMTLASNMGVALENARLFEETKRLLNESQQRNVELSILNAIQEGLVMEMDFTGIINLVGEKFREALGFQDLGIRIYDKETNTLNYPYEYEHGKRLYIDSTEPTPLSKYVIDTGKMLLLKKVSDEEIAKLGITGQTTIPGTDESKSLVFVPIIIGSEVKGLILIENYEKEDAFSESDIRLLTTVANSMSVALENARLFNETNRLLDETQQRNTELSIINTIQDGMVKEMDFDSVIKLVGDKLRETLNYQDIGIRIYNPDENLVYFPYEYEHGEKLDIEPMEPGATTSYVLKNKKALVLKKNDEETFRKKGIEGVNVIPGTDRSKSLIAIPLISGNEARGMFLIEDYEKEAAFDESDVRLLTTLANSMSVALENARLFNETNRLLNESEKRNNELSILNVIQEGLVSEMDIDTLISFVGDKFRETLGVVDIGIRLYDREKNLLHFPYEYEHGEKLTFDSMAPTPFSKYVLDTSKMLLLRENSDEEVARFGIEGQVTVPGTDRSKSLLMVPITRGNEAIGLIRLEDYENTNAFSDSDIRLLTTVANSMSVALENARLFNETLRLLEESKKRTDELSTVNSISQAIAGHLEINKLINLVGEKVRSLFKANIVYVALLDKDTEMIDFPYGYGDEYPPLKLGEGLTSKIILNKEPILINRKVDEREDKIIGMPSASYLGVPIPVGGDIIGVVSVQSTEKENLFNDDDSRLLTTIAAHVGIAINNANAYEELNKTLENLQSTQDQLIAQEKLASLGQLTAGIAHEIKNPLNFVNNFSELSVGLVDELSDEFENVKNKINEDKYADIQEILEMLQQNANKIKEHGKRADSIVHSMLQHSRGKRGEKQPTDINAMLEEDLNLVYHGLRAQDSTFNIKIEKNYQKDLPMLNVVPQDVSRVFLNILTNGCYEAHRKNIEDRSDDPAKIVITTIDMGKIIEIRIRDNGNGIPQKVRDNLFTPFFTTKPAGKGTGLGLSISYDIVVREHKGEILFETEEGKYTEFIVKLPK